MHSPIFYLRLFRYYVSDVVRAISGLIKEIEDWLQSH